MLIEVTAAPGSEARSTRRSEFYDKHAIIFVFINFCYIWFFKLNHLLYSLLNEKLCNC